MSAGAAIFAKLTTTSGVTAIVSSRIFPARVPQKVNAYPSIAYSIVQREPQRTMGGRSNLEKNAVSIACLARTYTAAAQLASAVRAALETQAKATWGTTDVVACFYRDSDETDFTGEGGEDDIVYLHSLDFDLWFRPVAGTP